MRCVYVRLKWRSVAVAVISLTLVRKSWWIQGGLLVPGRTGREGSRNSAKGVGSGQQLGRVEHRLVGRNVLVNPEEVVRVVLSLQGLEFAVFLRPVRLLNPLGTFLAQEIHIDAFVPGS